MLKKLARIENKLQYVGLPGSVTDTYTYIHTMYTYTYLHIYIHTHNPYARTHHGKNEPIQD